MLHKFNVKVLNQSGTYSVYTGTDHTTALTVYTMQACTNESDTFIELYKDNKFVRSTIGRV